MTMIFQMTHGKGRHIAYDANEAKLNEKNGWVTVTKEQFYDIKRYPSVENIKNPIDDDLKQLYEDKFGKPPHHAMKEAGIKKALNG